MQPRRGAATVVAISFLVIIALLLASMTRLLAVSREQSQVQLRSLESEWLVEVGQQHAQRQLANRPDYQGESWTLQSEDKTHRTVTMTRNDETQQMIVTGEIKREQRTLAAVTRSISLVEKVNNEEN
ncbi:MAG: hypothetical protein AAF497_27360 [Planctomycetota bacterium]